MAEYGSRGSEMFRWDGEELMPPKLLAGDPSNNWGARCGTLLAAVQLFYGLEDSSMGHGEPKAIASNT